MSEVLTQEYLKRILKYNPATGVFTWRVSSAKHVKVGDVAGKPRCDGYRRVRILGKLQYAHRLVWLYMYGRFPTKYLDHINGDTSDNRLANLREATNYENQHNQGRRKNNTSGYKGVSWDKSMNKWEAYITKDYKKVHLGYFDTTEEAFKAYTEEAKEHQECNNGQ